MPGQDAQDLVAELWRRQPPVAHELAGEEPEACLAGLRDTLATVAADAASLARDRRRADQAGAHLLAETARAIHDALGATLSAWSGAPRLDAVTPWADRLRFARMERWLAARAEDDPSAEPSASLCLWVIEHLETSVPLPRRIPPT
jgi:hypothetical protein